MYYDFLLLSFSGFSFDIIFFQINTPKFGYEKKKNWVKKVGAKFHVDMLKNTPG